MSSLAGGTVAGQALVIASTPLITRLYGPAEMGQLGLFISFLSVASLAVTLRFELAIPAADEQTANRLLILALLFSLPLSALGSMALMGMIHYNLVSFGLLSPWVGLAMLPALLSMGVFSALRYWLVRHKRFQGIGKVMMIQGAGRAIVPIVFGLFKLSSIGLIAGEIAGRILGVTEMARSSWSSLRAMLTEVNASGLQQTARRHWKFPSIVLPSSLVDVAALALPAPLFAHYYGEASAGLFLLVQRLTFLPASLISASIADVFHARAADVSNDEGSRLIQILNSTTKGLAKYGAVVLIPAAVISPFVFGWLFGGRWAEAGILVTVIAPWAFASLVVSPVSRLLVVVHRNEWKLIYDFLSLGSVVAGIGASHAGGLNFREALAVTSGLQVFSFLIYFGLLRWAAKNPGRTSTIVEEALQEAHDG